MAASAETLVFSSLWTQTEHWVILNLSLLVFHLESFTFDHLILGPLNWN